MSLPSGPGSDEASGRIASEGGSTPSGEVITATHNAHTVTPTKPIELALSRQLPAFAWASTINPFDTELDHYQRDAVARACASPDFVLIQGPSGTGKTRVAIEVARQFVAQGKRVVWFAQNQVALNCAIAHFAKIPQWAFRRLCGPNEQKSSLDSVCREHLIETVEAREFERSLAEANRQKQSAEDRLRLLATLGELLVQHQQSSPALANAKDKLDRFSAKLLDLGEQIEQEIAQTEDSGSYLVQRIRKLDQQVRNDHADCEEKLAELSRRRATTMAEMEEVKAELEELRPKSEAAKSGGIFSISKWKAMLDTSLPVRQSAAEKKQAEIEQRLEELLAEENKIRESSKAVVEENQSKRARFFAEEVERISTELKGEIAELGPKVAELTALQNERTQRLEHAGYSTGDSISRIDEEIELLRRRLTVIVTDELKLAEHAANVARMWASTVPCVIGPVEAIAGLTLDRFDLMILDDAHTLQDASIESICSMADRWVFVGEPPERQHRHGAARPEWWGRLWHSLHHPRTWVLEGEHLVCRLHPLTAAERRKCDREPVADNPSIELRLATFLDEPVLAEVAFPVHFQTAAAREFLFRELDELTIQPATHSPVWETSHERITCRFAFPEAGATVSTANHPGGITEEIRDLDTLAIHFAVSENWTVPTASDWLLERGLKRSPGRAISLQRPQRASLALASWLNESFRVGYYIAPRSAGESPVEFLAVPDLRGRREPANHRQSRSGGAGYEIALHDSKQRSLLSDELSKLLPEKGYVNLAEAQAIVHFVENHPSSSIRVTSPFPAQTIVLKQLFSKSRASQVRVLDPTEALGCECDLLLISLTRSHVSRAVTFGDSPAILRRLVGCARRKIMFAGDPGTLSRRLQWEGPVDHLDATDAAIERNWVAALADCPRVNANRHRPSPTSA